MRRLRAEWEKQEAILMAFPHKRSDWAEHIDEARECFCHIIEQILAFENVVLCVDNEDKQGMQILQDRFSSYLESNVLDSKARLILVSIPTNDTWARDFGGIGVEESSKTNKIIDFGFNGWGLKFPACFDNQITQNLYKLSAHNSYLAKLFPTSPIKADLILEGGSIESNGNGILLTNTQCLLESNRNPHLSQAQIESKLKEYFGLKEVLWLTRGYLAGDDTDGHIDMLARFITPHSIAYIKCDDPNDEHYEELCAMERELQNLRQSDGTPYNLIALPFTQAIYDKVGERLPTSYANFLFINGAILVPTYGDQNDDKALEILSQACPQHQVIGVDCHTLILWHGSLHCITMQLYG